MLRRMAGYFSTTTFAFLRDLERHNERDWFLANKTRYERDARDPMLAFIRDVAPKLRKLSANFDVDPRPVGGSMMRIYRDVRFSADKSPYKTHLAAHFQHARCEGSAPGFYLRIGVGESLLGAGVWHPEPAALGRIRDAIADKTPEWRRAVKGLKLDGEVLKRPPKGYDADHASIEDIKRKDFITGREFRDAEVCAADFLERFIEGCRTTAPLVRFLCGALKLPF
jgi:uncharacterized protein (TIGR02453 family)